MQKTIDDITAIKLSNRTFHSEYVTYTALSRTDGITEYTVTLNGAGHATGCTCPARVKCCHMKACEFEEAWTAPIAEQVAVAASIETVLLGSEFAQDLEQHVTDSIESGEFVDPFAGMSKAEQQEAYRAMYPDDFYFAA